MQTPVFSVIIPTRNRYETLVHAVRTVLDQRFESFELVLSDNSSADEYKENEKVREDFSDPRISFYRPDSELAMSDHWEFAVSKAKGRYLIIFGDDDGLVPDALSVLSGILNKTNADIVNWVRAEYSWPDRRPSELANELILPYVAPTGIIDSRKYIKKVVFNRADYRSLPMFYNSVVKRELVDKLISLTGRVFNGISPDIYTGYAFAFLSGRYLTLGYPLSINGVSSKSNGSAHLNNDRSIKQDFHDLFKKSKIKWPPSLPNFITPYTAIIEPFVQLQGYFSELSGVINRREIYKIIIDTLPDVDNEIREQMMAEVRESAKDDARLSKWVSSYKGKSAGDGSNIISIGSRVGFDGSYLHLDLSAFGLMNVHEVSEFIPRIVGKFKYSDFTRTLDRSLIERIRRAGGVIIKGF